ncbi:protein MpSUVR1 [Marchantia polymorpha subsp. ruderalis]
MGPTGKERANRAFEAMEELGLDRKSINPILRELLKVYNNEWSYIEAENYRLLADQAFEQQEAVVTSKTPASPRQTRGSVSSASTSSAEKGKKPICYVDSMSSETRTTKDEKPRAHSQEVAARPLVGAGRGSAKPDLLAKVKTEKEADGTSEPVSTPLDVEHAGIRPMRDRPELLKNEETKLGQSSPAASAAAPSLSPGKKIDAQTLEETLRRVASTNPEMSIETRSTGVDNGTLLIVSEPDKKATFQAIKDNGNTKPDAEKMELANELAKESLLPSSSSTIMNNGHQIVERSVHEPASDKIRGDGVVMSGGHSCPKPIGDNIQWFNPGKDGESVLLLLADNYSEDEEDELNVPIKSVEPQSGNYEPEVLDLIRKPDSGLINKPREDRQQQPLESIKTDPVNEESPKQPLDKDFCVEELEPAVGTPERIRPRFILGKVEVAAASDEDSQPISGLIRFEAEGTPATLKRGIADLEEPTHLKRMKHDMEPEAGPSLQNGFVSCNEVSLKDVTQDNDDCPRPSSAAAVFSSDDTKKNLTKTESTSRASSKRSLITADSNNSAGTRRKLIISVSPSPEGSPVGKPCVNNDVSGSVKTNGCLSTANLLELEAATTTPMSKTNGAVTSGGSDLSIPENVMAAIAVVNTVIHPDEFEDGPARKKLAHCPTDISRGTERLPIPYVNEYNSDTIPSLFKYIPVNTTFQDAYVNFSLARVGEEDCCGGCYGDCLKAPYPCTCTRETGGVFAYTKDGLLKDEYLQHEVDSLQNEELKEKLVTFCQSGWDCPIERAKSNFPENCKGHLSRNFIKECWHKCGCSMECGNRVVQRGITRNLQIFFTQEGKGWGLRTLEQLPPGAFVCEYVGEIMTNIELDKRNHAQKGESVGAHTYPILLDGDWCSEKGLKDEEALCLDATNFGNVARFINHRCFDANLIDMPVTIESPDRHYYHVAFFTSRAVRANEELTWDYKIDFDDNEHPIEAFRCLCKSPFCRGSSGKKAKKVIKKTSC